MVYNAAECAPPTRGKLSVGDIVFALRALCDKHMLSASVKTARIASFSLVVAPRGRAQLKDDPPPEQPTSLVREIHGKALRYCENAWLSDQPFVIVQYHTPIASLLHHRCKKKLCACMRGLGHQGRSKFGRLRNHLGLKAIATIASTNHRRCLRRFDNKHNTRNVESCVLGAQGQHLRFIIDDARPKKTNTTCLRIALGMLIANIIDANQKYRWERPRFQCFNGMLTATGSIPIVDACHVLRKHEIHENTHTPPGYPIFNGFQGTVKNTHTYTPFSADRRRPTALTPGRS